MRHLVQIHVLVLLAAVVFGTLANGNMLAHAPEPARNAGCHEHSNPAPKSPVSYACCQMGHGSMLVRAVESGPQDLSMVALQPAVIHFDSHVFYPAAANPVSSGGEPPGFVPLRI